MLSKINNKLIVIITALFVLLTFFVALPMTGESDIYAASQGTIKNGPLNVRSGPGTTYTKLGTIAKGKTITITDTKKDKSGTNWYKFKFGSKNGYVSSQYVTVKSTSPGTVTYSKAKTGVIKNGPLTVRSNAGTSYSKLGTLAKGKTVSLKGEKKDSKGAKWYRITFSSKKGYIHSSYVTVKSGNTSSSSVINKSAVVKDGPLNVRSGAGTNYSKIGSMPEGKQIKVKTAVKNTKGETWYSFAYSSSKTGYVLSSYIKLVADSGDGSNLSDSKFEKWMDDQGFPSSYKTLLRELHDTHPEWIFKAHDTGLNWSSMLEKETRVGNNLVEPGSPTSWKSKESGAYKNGKWVVFDGKWNAASDAITSYYLDPRNFLNESSIYQFMDHSFDSDSQTKSTIKSIVSKNSSCFMNNTSYINYLYNAGVKSKVNPNVITAMVVMEQGWKGGSNLISGKYSGYKGYYNHFNIGAYTTSTMSSTQRGLWWAKGAGTGEKTYGRPWTSIEKSLAGGAEYYASNYITKKQNTYYTKKFNVMNGLSKVATHEYMTNVSGAESEGKVLKYAYEADDNLPIVFYIPVYSSMPSKACPKP